MSAVNSFLEVLLMLHLEKWFLEEEQWFQKSNNLLGLIMVCKYGHIY